MQAAITGLLRLLTWKSMIIIHQSDHKTGKEDIDFNFDYDCSWCAYAEQRFVINAFFSIKIVSLMPDYEVHK